MKARRVPFFDYSGLYNDHREAYLSAIDGALARGAFILQRDLEEFEVALAQFLGVPYLIGVANGTDALLLALRANNVTGGEVIVPSHTYVATAAAIHFVGAVPRLVDCGSDHLIDPGAVDRAVCSSTTGIIPVHLNGRTCDMDRILAIAETARLPVIEDAAQGVGSRFRGRSAGSFGAAGALSFYPAKTLGAFGDAGAVITGDKAIAERVRTLRDHGRHGNDVMGWGFNSRLDNVQAAILLIRLRYLPDEIRRRREIAQVYTQGLSDIEDLTLPPPPCNAEGRFDSFQNYELESGRRDELRQYLFDHGIGTIIQWGGLPLHRIAALGLHTDDLPQTDRLFGRCFMLPMHPRLTPDDTQYTVGQIRSFYAM